MYTSLRLGPISFSDAEHSVLTCILDCRASIQLWAHINSDLIVMLIHRHHLSHCDNKWWSNENVIDSILIELRHIHIKIKNWMVSTMYWYIWFYKEIDHILWLNELKSSLYSPTMIVYRSLDMILSFSANFSHETWRYQ